MRTLVMVLVFLSAANLSAQSLDPALKAAMDATGLKYSVTKSGNAAVTYGLSDDRSQVVYVAGRKTKVGLLELREVWSNGATVASDVSFDVLLDLLTGGGKEDIGAWNLEEADDGYLAYYATRIPELAPTNLTSVLEYVASVADAKEAELTGEDEN